MSSQTQTNSSLSAKRDCPRMYHLGYNRQLEFDGDEPEYFTVGSAWHAGMEHKGTPWRFDAIRRAAPSELWGEKLSTLAAAYDWYWESQPLEIVQAEFVFEVEFEGRTLRGQIDGIVRMPDGRVGLIEYKTTSDALDGGLMDKLRLDTQTGLYSLAATAMDLFPNGMPDFIIYDVTRKPTIKPKTIPKAEIQRMLKEHEKTGQATYFEQLIPNESIKEFKTLAKIQETPVLYGARLRADIGDQPGKYFARREVTRTAQDYDCLLDDIRAQLDELDFIATQEAPHYSRNPNHCNNYSQCQFASLCWNNVDPNSAKIPEGFRIRKHRHQELDGKVDISDLIL